MKHSFVELDDLVKFLQDNLDKKYKIKTKFSYKKDTINIEKYEVVEMKYVNKKNTYKITACPYSINNHVDFQIAELPEPLDGELSILDSVSKCNGIYTVYVKATDRDEAELLGTKLINDYIRLQSWEKPVFDKRFYKIIRYNLGGGSYSLVAKEEPSISDENLKKLNMISTEDLYDIYTYVEASTEGEAISLGKNIFSCFLDNIIYANNLRCKPELKVFCVSTKDYSVGFFKSEEVLSNKESLIVNCVKKISENNYSVYVESSDRDNAVLVGIALIDKYHVKTKKYTSKNDIEKAFQEFKKDVKDKYVGNPIGKLYWNRMFNGNEILDLAKSFYDTNWGYKEKLLKIKDLNNIKISGMFLTDKFLTITLLADLEKK